MAGTCAVAVALTMFIASRAANATGPYRAFQIGLWSGGAYTDDRNGAFSHCSAGVTYDSGLNMFLVGTAGHGWWIGLTNPRWSLTANASLPVKLRFDQRPASDAVATAADGQLLLVPISEDSHLIDSFRHSNQLTVTVQDQSFPLSLGGAASVIAELTNCVRTAVALETPTPTVSPPAAAASDAAASAPPAAPIATSAPEPSRMPAARGPTELEEAKLATNFLLAARLPDAHLVSTGKPAALASFKAVWRSEDAAGAVKIIPSGRDVTGLGIASDLIAVDPKLCKGDFAAARSHRVIDGAEVFEAVLSCADGRDRLTTQYFITPHQAGGFVVFAVIGSDGAAATPDGGGQNAELFGKAVVHAVGSEE